MHLVRQTVKKLSATGADGRGLSTKTAQNVRGPGMTSSPRLDREVHIVVVLPAQQGQEEVKAEQYAYDV